MAGYESGTKKKATGNVGGLTKSGKRRKAGVYEVYTKDGISRKIRVKADKDYVPF